MSRKTGFVAIVLLSIMSSFLSSLVIHPTPVQAAVPAAKIIFTFDDGWADQYTYAFPIMQTAGFKGTVYAVRDATIDEWPDMMSENQINAVYNAGWDISNHTTNHDDNGDDTSTARLAQLKKVYEDNQNWILSNGWTRGAYHVCYPSGAFSNQLITILKGMGVLTGRSVIDGIQSIPVTDFFRIPVQYVEAGNVEEVEDSVDSAIATGGTVVLMIHRVLPYDDNLVITTADFQQIVNYVKTRVNNNSLAVMTMSEWYNALTGTPSNHAPVAVANTYNATEDTNLNITAPGVLTNDTDIDGDTLTAVKVTGPAHGTLTLNPNGSFTYTPTANYNGPDSFTYKASDGALDSNTATVTITVAAVNDAPVAVNDAYNVTEDITLNITAPGVLTNDTDIDGDTLTAVKVTGPAHGTLTLNPNGSFTYTPAPNFNGLDSFTYKASDGDKYSSPATVTIVVEGKNDAPEAVDDVYDATVGTTLNIAAPGVLTNDTDIDNDPLTAVKVTGPTHGTLTLNPNGFFTYTPNAGFNGPDIFTYKANDGVTDSNTATVTINVSLNIMEGDVNLDGYVTITDAMLIAQYKAGLLILTEEQLQCADTTDDGIVSIADAMHISQWLVDPDGSLGVLFKPLWESPADDSMLQPLPK